MDSPAFGPLTLASLVTLTLAGCAAADVTPVRFELLVENIALEPINGPAGSYMAVFSPGWIRATADEPLFVEGEVASAALRSLAEQGDPTLFASEGGVSIPPEFAATYDGDPLFPGMSVTTEFDGVEGDDLYLVTMMGVSNDAFIGVRMPLFEDGQPMEGEITSFARLYDAGTEVNEPFGHGENQPSSGAGGDEEGASVRAFVPDDAGNTPPAVDQMLRLTLRRVEL